MLRHHISEHQWIVNHFCSCILGDQGIVLILELITELLTAFIGKNAKHKRKDTDSKIINIANWKTCKKRFLHVEYVTLMRYYYQRTKTRAIYESKDEPAAQPTDNPPNSDGLGDFHRSLPEVTVWVH